MADDTFDFAFVDKAWTWSHRMRDEVVETSTRSFPSLHDCMGDARRAGFHASADPSPHPVTVRRNDSKYAAR